MAVEIDSIVKSIESEKISEEERQQMRDVWSRIDGTMDKVITLIFSTLICIFLTGTPISFCPLGAYGSTE